MLSIAQFEAVLPKVLELICEGMDLRKALKTLPTEPRVDPGAFMRWLKKSTYYQLFVEAKEVRTEFWAGEMIRHATGENDDDTPYTNDTARSKLIVDTLWKLMAANNRKEYGASQTIEINQSISVTSALAAAAGRVIEANVVDDDDEPRRLSAAIDVDEDDNE